MLPLALLKLPLSFAELPSSSKAAAMLPPVANVADPALALLAAPASAFPPLHERDSHAKVQPGPRALDQAGASAGAAHDACAGKRRARAPSQQSAAGATQGDCCADTLLLRTQAAPSQPRPPSPLHDNHAVIARAAAKAPEHPSRVVRRSFSGGVLDGVQPCTSDAAADASACAAVSSAPCAVRSAPPSASSSLPARARSHPAASPEEEQASIRCVFLPKNRPDLAPQPPTSAAAAHSAGPASCLTTPGTALGMPADVREFLMPPASSPSCAPSPAAPLARPRRCVASAVQQVYYCSQPGRVGMASMGVTPKRSRAKPNQDACVVERDPSVNLMLMAVFDGHGPHGHLVSSYFRDHLFSVMRRHEAYPHNMCEVLRWSLEHVEAQVIADPDIPTNRSGCTASCAVVQGDLMTVANVGDSRCVPAARFGAGHRVSLSVCPCCAASWLAPCVAVCCVRPRPPSTTSPPCPRSTCASCALAAAWRTLCTRVARKAPRECGPPTGCVLRRLPRAPPAA